MQQRTQQSENQPGDPQLKPVVIRPWYKEPWPWILIALPLITIIASFITLYLAISRPDYLVVDDQEMQQVKAGLRAQDLAEKDVATAAPVVADDPDGER